MVFFYCCTGVKNIKPLSFLTYCSLFVCKNAVIPSFVVKISHPQVESMMCEILFNTVIEVNIREGGDVIRVMYQIALSFPREL